MAYLLFLFFLIDMMWLKIFDMIEDFDYIELEEGGGYSSVELLAGYYFMDIGEISNVLEIFMRYFDYEAYGRDILFEYEVYEGQDSFYLFR